MRAARVERERGRSALADPPLLRLVREPRPARRLRLARGGLGDAHPRAASSPRMAGARGRPPPPRTGPRGETLAAPGPPPPSLLFPVGGGAPPAPLVGGLPLGF